MASLAMASSTAVSMASACACGTSPVFSSTSSVRMASISSSTSFGSPLRVAGTSRNLYVVPMASPQGTQSTSLEGAVQHAIDEANEVCAEDVTSGNCAAAWDEVEELASTVAHRKVSDKEKKDPLEQFCKEVPEAEECRVYEE